MCFLIHSMCGITVVHEATFLFLAIDVECRLQTNNYPSINRPRKSKEERKVCAGRERGGSMDGGGGEKLLSSRGASLAIRTSGVLCVLLVRLLRVGKEGIHTGVQAPQKAPAAVGPRPYSDEKPVIERKEHDRTICSRLHPSKVAKSRPAPTGG